MLHFACKDMSKVRRSVTLSKETLEWIEQQIKRKRFSNVSHALEYTVFELMEKEKRAQKQE